MRIDFAGRIKPHHLRQKRLIADDQIGRHAACTNDLLPMINVIEKQIECADALLDAALQKAPFLRGDDAWNEIERNEAFIRSVIAINREGNAKTPENGVGFLLLAGHAAFGLLAHPIGDFRVGWPD